MWIFEALDQELPLDKIVNIMPFATYLLYG